MLISISVILNIIAVITLLSLQKMHGSRGTRDLKNSLDELSRGIGDEFQRSRLDTGNYQKMMRDETAKNLNDISLKMAEMTKSGYEQQINLSEKISRSLSDLWEINAQQSEKQSNIIKESISKMQDSNEKKLDQMRSTVDEKLTTTLTSRLESSFKTVSDQLENVYKSLGEMKELSAGVTDNVTALNRVLTNVKARGTWAEVLLQSILDQTIPGMYEKNFATKPGSPKRIEFAIKIPSSDDAGKLTYLPIDSKFPMESYIRLCEAADKADVQALEKARKELEDIIKLEAKSIKEYINEPYTTPFAIMYLATEGLYAEIASSRSGILEKLQSEYNIVIAGPTTITALLNSIAMGFRSIAINEKANEVRQLLSVAKAQYEMFGDVLEKASRKIAEAGKTLEDAQHRNTIIRKKLKKVEDLSQDETVDLLDSKDIED
ncbi:MAG: DNA recombination protein RmuC [Oscillospiraceae bacterium]|jgi:DNA recombination protein RmuC|nr:DNA recombination protein RmuC [Oscillospiraceae bacterium]